MFISKEQYAELETAVNDLIKVTNELKTKNKMLENENAYLKDLIDKLTRIPQVVTNPGTFRVGPYEWPAAQPPYKMDHLKGYTACTTCGITGANGYCCPRTDCPSGVSCST